MKKVRGEEEKSGYEKKKEKKWLLKYKTYCLYYDIILLTSLNK